MFEAQGAAVEMVDEATRGANHHMRTALELLQLRYIRRAAVQTGHAQAVDGFTIGTARFGDLNRQFTGWGEDEHLRFRQRGVDLRQKWQ